MNFDPLANFVLDPPAVPEQTLRMAATLLVDTLGVAAGAASMDAGRIARNHAHRFHAALNASDAATMLFDGRAASLPGAAFATATQIDNLDAHDGLNATKGHIGCAVVPALCAFAEQKPDLSARDALRAMVVGYEVAARAGFALHATVADYHTSGAWNSLGVAALGCLLRKSTPTQLRHALGIAEYHGPRSQMMREIANPTMLHDGSGMGAFVGAMAVLLAEQGFEGAPAITVEDHAVLSHWNDLGVTWTTDANYIKPYPICRWAHGALDALSGLIRDHSVVAKDIRSIEVHTFAESAALFPGMPSTTSQAQYSLAFSLAALVVHGELGPAQIQGAELRNPDVADLIARISVHEDTRHSARFPSGRWSNINLHLNDGTVLQSGDVNARGGPESPMSNADFDAKFLTMTRCLGHKRQQDLLKMRKSLMDPNLKFAELLALLHAPVEASAR